MRTNASRIALAPFVGLSVTFEDFLRGAILRWSLGVSGYEGPERFDLALIGFETLDETLSG